MGYLRTYVRGDSVDLTEETNDLIRDCEGGFIPTEASSKAVMKVQLKDGRTAELKLTLTTDESDFINEGL